MVKIVFKLKFDLFIGFFYAYMFYEYIVILLLQKLSIYGVIRYF